MSVHIKQALDQTYLDPNGRAKMLGNYIYDNELSNDETMVYYNPNENKLLIGFRGTSNLDDVGTDASLAFGELRNTTRYDRSKSDYEKAKSKYNGSKTTLLGHSLGGSLASAIGKDDTEIITFNKGNSLIPSTATKTKPNEKSYRIKGDVVSIIPDRNTKTINNKKYINYFKPWLYNTLQYHSTKNLQNQNIYV